jgi:hypothetical protein
MIVMQNMERCLIETRGFNLTLIQGTYINTSSFAKANTSGGSLWTYKNNILNITSISLPYNNQWNNFNDQIQEMHVTTPTFTT